MIYRDIGKTGMSAGIIGLGTEHLDFKPYADVQETIFAAMDHGINMMDLFMPGEEVRKNIGRAIAGKRDKWLIQGHICSTDINRQYDISRDLKTSQKYFENLLKYLNTDYIDFGMLFYIDTEEDYKAVFETEIFDYARSLKEKGVVRALGASSHNPVTARKVVESGVIDLLMFSINPAFDMMPAGMIVDDMLEDGAISKASGIEPSRAQLYRACERENVSITVMKTLGAGKLLTREFSPFAQPLSVGQCIHYALSMPAVKSVLLGCKSAKEIEDAVNYLNLSAEEKDYSGIISSAPENFAGQCVYCNHCLPCPSDINIASVNKYLDIALLDEANVPADIKQHYGALEAHGSDCIQCGSCEARCPFGVSVINNMERAATVFGE